MTHCLKIILHRSHIQGGLTNEEVDGIKGAPVFTERMFFHLYDFWEIHITNYVKKWKEYKNVYQSPYSNVSVLMIYFQIFMIVNQIKGQNLFRKIVMII